MPHCIHILKSADAECTGMLRIVLALAHHTQPLGWTSSILFLGPGPLAQAAREAGVPYAVVPWDGSRRDLRGAWCAGLWLRGQNFTVAHVHHGGLAVRALCRLAGARAVVQHLHSRILENAGGASIEGLSFRGADAVIAASHAVAACVRGARCEVIYAGVDAPGKPTEPPTGATFRIGVLSRLVPLKNVAAILQAVARLAEQGIAVELDVAGSGPEEASLQELAAKFGIAPQVHFLGWRADAQALLTTWHLLVVASDEESFCLSALQAMAAARPVLATRVGGLPELVDDGVTGRLVAPRDIPALAAALREFAANPAGAARMGLAGWERAQRNFSATEMARRTVELYARILAD